MIRRIAAISQITVLETLSKKHLYILILILIGIYFYFGRMDFFGLGMEASFIKLVPLTGISIFALVVTILATARQIPDERQNKTIFPLLAKPVSRFEFLAGKFLGVSSMVVFTILVTATLFYFLLSAKGVKFNALYWQAIVLQCLQFCVFISIVLALSTVLSHAATVVLAFLLFYLLGSAGSTLEDMLFSDSFPDQMRGLYQGLLAALPRLDLFNITKAVIHDLPPQSWVIVLPFVGYAAAASLVFLLIGSLLFRRKDL